MAEKELNRPTAFDPEQQTIGRSLAGRSNSAGSENHDNPGSPPDVLFTEKLSSNDFGKPVGICSEGVLFWDYRDRAHGRSLEILPWSDVDEVWIRRETRIWRIVTSVLMFVGCVAATCFGLTIFAGMMDGRVTGIGAIQLSILGFLGLFACLVVPFRCFTKLGYYFRIQSEGRRKRYYVDGKTWESNREWIKLHLQRIPGRVVDSVPVAFA